MNIFVGNLPPETSLSELLGCFEPFGKVSDITISTFKFDGLFRGLGFIEMPSHDHGQAAIDGLQGKELGGNMLRVRED